MNFEPTTALTLSVINKSAIIIYKLKIPICLMPLLYCYLHCEDDLHWFWTGLELGICGLVTSGLKYVTCSLIRQLKLIVATFELPFYSFSFPFLLHLFHSLDPFYPYLPLLALVSVPVLPSTRTDWFICRMAVNGMFLGRLFDRVDLIKPFSNVRPNVSTWVHTSVRPEKVSLISMKFGM